MDQSPTVELVKRKNVEVRCPCPFLKCLNGGYCMAGSPPYCICAAGYGGTYCEIPPVKQPIVGKYPVASCYTWAYFQPELLK